MLEQTVPVLLVIVAILMAVMFGIIYEHTVRRALRAIWTDLQEFGNEIAALPQLALRVFRHRQFKPATLAFGVVGLSAAAVFYVIATFAGSSVSEATTARTFAHATSYVIAAVGSVFMLLRATAPTR